MINTMVWVAFFVCALILFVIANICSWKYEQTPKASTAAAALTCAGVGIGLLALNSIWLVHRILNY